LGRPLTWLDVFTATRLTGNGLAVVHDADGVSDETMLGFARETNLSETTFAQTATEPGADYRNRIWMATGELDFAGHPSLGTAVALAHVRGEREASYVQQTRAGLQPIDVRLDGDVAYASMLQGPATFGEELDPGPVLGAAGLRLDAADPDLPCQVVSTGQPHLMAPVRSPELLAQLRIDAGALDELLRPLGGTVLYLAARDGDRRVHARSFFVQDGIVREDPATGSAAGPLMALLHARAGDDAVTIAQGVEMGRPSRIECRIDGELVRVGGNVVVLAQGEIAL
jgi:trans-2,3-dihydro-3-hydroxyanthranilate isomerase